MGWWASEHGTIGDWPADIMDRALRDIENAFLRDAHRLPTQGELADLIEFSTCGTLKPQCGNPNMDFTKAMVGDPDYPRAAERGAQGINGPASRKSTFENGGMVNVDPSTGKHWQEPDWEKVDEDVRRIEEEQDGDQA